MGAPDIPHETTGSDGALMVLVPEGDFVRGDDERYSEKPSRHVYLDAYFIDKYPVTHEQYLGFIEATGHGEPQY